MFYILKTILCAFADKDVYLSIWFVFLWLSMTTATGPQLNWPYILSIELKNLDTGIDFTSNKWVVVQERTFHFAIKCSYKFHWVFFSAVISICTKHKLKKKTRHMACVSFAMHFSFCSIWASLKRNTRKIRAAAQNYKQIQQQQHAPKTVYFQPFYH